MFTVNLKGICEGIHAQIVAKPNDNDIANSAAILFLCLSHDKLRDLGNIDHRRVRFTGSNAPRVRSTRTRVDNNQFSVIALHVAVHFYIGSKKVRRGISV